MVWPSKCAIHQRPQKHLKLGSCSRYNLGLYWSSVRVCCVRDIAWAPPRGLSVFQRAGFQKRVKSGLTYWLSVRNGGMDLPPCVHGPPPSSQLREQGLEKPSVCNPFTSSVALQEEKRMIWLLSAETLTPSNMGLASSYTLNLVCI